MFFHAFLSVTLASVDSTAGAASSSTQTLILQPVRGTPLRIDFNYNFDQALPPFAKEPSLPGKELARGRIPSVPPTPILRNITDNELYANVDHTQDFVTGKFDTYRSTYNGHVFFSDVRVSSVQDLLTIPYTVDLFTYEHGCAGWLSVRSGWAGQLDLRGKKWRLGIVDNLDGQIGTNDILYLDSAQPERSDQTICVSPVPRTLFLEGFALNLRFQFKSSPTGVVLETILSECQPPLGQLKIAVQHGKYCPRRGDFVALFCFLLLCPLGGKEPGVRPAAGSRLWIDRIPFLNFPAALEDLGKTMGAHLKHVVTSFRSSPQPVKLGAFQAATIGPEVREIKGAVGFSSALNPHSF
jgi:hypothetical protein